MIEKVDEIVIGGGMEKKLIEEKGIDVGKQI